MRWKFFIVTVNHFCLCLIHCHFAQNFDLFKLKKLNFSFFSFSSPKNRVFLVDFSLQDYQKLSFFSPRKIINWKISSRFDTTTPTTTTTMIMINEKYWKTKIETKFHLVKLWHLKTNKLCWKNIYFIFVLKTLLKNFCLFLFWTWNRFFFCSPFHNNDKKKSIQSYLQSKDYHHHYYRLFIDYRSQNFFLFLSIDWFYFWFF